MAQARPQAAADDEEAGLWRAFKMDGSAAAREALFERHLAFARQIAARHFLDRRRGDLELEDLCQFACTGLLEALDRFDSQRGVPFRAFARRRIAGSVLDGLAHLSELREQLSFRQRMRRERLRSLAVDNPDGLPAADAMQALIEMATGLALGFMIDGAGMVVSDNEADTGASPYESTAWREMVRSLRAEIGALTGQEQKIITYHYLHGLAFDQIARAFGVTKGRISQIHRSALRVLKDRMSRRAFSLEK